MIEIEYGEQQYVDGEHVPDCPSLHVLPLPTVEGSTVTFECSFCSGCLPLPDPRHDTSA